MKLEVKINKTEEAEEISKEHAELAQKAQAEFDIKEADVKEEAEADEVEAEQQTVQKLEKKNKKLEDIVFETKQELKLTIETLNKNVEKTEKVPQVLQKLLKDYKNIQLTAEQAKEKKVAVF